MAQKIACRNCGAAIDTRFLSVGDEALCAACGKRTPVPKSAESFPNSTTSDMTRAGPIYGKAAKQERAEILVARAHAVLQEWNVHPTIRLYSRRAIFWFSLFFTVFAGGLLLAANWRRLGFKAKSHWTILVTGAIFVVIIVYTVMILQRPDVKSGAGALSLVLALIIQNHTNMKQGVVLRALGRVGRKPAPVGKPLLIAVGCTLTFLIVMGFLLPG